MSWKIPRGPQSDRHGGLESVSCRVGAFACVLGVDGGEVISGQSRYLRWRDIPRWDMMLLEQRMQTLLVQWGCWAWLGRWHLPANCRQWQCQRHMPVYVRTNVKSQMLLRKWYQCSFTTLEWPANLAKIINLNPDLYRALELKTLDNIDSSWWTTRTSLLAYEYVTSDFRGTHHK